MKKKIITSIIIAVGILCSCRPTLYLPLSTNATEQQELLTGRKIYVDHCGSCHNLHLPKEYSTEGWNTQLNKMQIKAKITDEEKQCILKYLTSQP